MRNGLSALLLISVTACGGGSDIKSDGSLPPDTEPNTAPTIAGMPATTISVGASYSFIPTASDADGDTLTFTVENPPSWADFDPANGSLTGLPDASDVGITSNIVISVSDGRTTSALAPFDLEVLEASPGQALVTWTAPSTNADGTGLIDLAGFTIHYSQESGRYTNSVIVDDASATNSEIVGLEPGRWYFAVSAFDESGNHSELSDEVSKVVIP